MSIDLLAAQIHEWANNTFPDRTPQSMFLKLYSEIGEMIEGEGGIDGEEFADVMILLLDYAVSKNIIPSVAINQKMAVNRNRTWTKNSLGAYSHVTELTEFHHTQISLRISEAPGDRSGDAPASGQEVAHDRNQSCADAGGAHGERCVAGHDSVKVCPYRGLCDGRPDYGCIGPRHQRGVPGGHPDAHQAPDAGYEFYRKPGPDPRAFTTDSEGGEP